MTNARDHMLLEYSHLPDGAVLSGQLCPSCGGGQGAETSLSVGRTGDLLWWRCHRNKCGFRGMHGSRGSHSLTKAVHQKGRWNYEREPLSKAWLQWLSRRFRIPNDVISREWEWTDSYGGRVVMPVRNERGIATAYNLRSYNEEDQVPQKKALIHRVMEEAGQAWYVYTPYPSHIIITEDQPSALRAAQWTGVASIALLGTHLPESLVEKLRLLYDYRPRVLLALDQDATPEAAEAVLKWNGRLPSLKLLALDKDIKDMTQEEYECLMKKAKAM